MHYSAEEKVTLLRRHLEQGEAVSKLCEDQGLRPTVFYRWKNWGMRESMTEQAIEVIVQGARYGLPTIATAAPPARAVVAGAHWRRHEGVDCRPGAVARALRRRRKDMRFTRTGKATPNGATLTLLLPHLPHDEELIGGKCSIEHHDFFA